MQAGSFHDARRARSPEETLAWLNPLLERIGISRLAEITGLDSVGIPVFEAHRPNAKDVTISLGKGTDRSQAKISAVMEGIEYFHLEELEPATHRVPVREMQKHLSYDVHDLFLNNPSWLNGDLLLDWVECATLITQRRTYVPLSYLKIESSDMRWTPPCFSTWTVGVASGNTLEEATVQGLYEVIERDCGHAALQAATVPTAELAAGLVPDGLSKDLLSRYETAQNVVRILDITSHLGVPTYCVYAWSPATRVMHAGCGTHRDPDIALARALAEAAQSRLATISGMRDDLPAYLWAEMAGGTGVPPEAAAKGASTASWPSADLMPVTFAAEAALLAGLIAGAAGSEPVLVDLTRDDLAIPVIRVVAPGLQNWDYREQ